MTSDRENTVRKVGETQLLAEARQAVLLQSKKNEFEPTPYVRATELLESLPAVKFVDARVQLALDITRATRNDYRPDLSRRALYAAFPAGSEVIDVALRRKWFSFAGVIEAAFGSVDRSLKCKLIALELCQESKEWWAFHLEWNNFSILANGAGLYHDAIRYATVALDTKGAFDPIWLEIRGAAFYNRANSLMRLGRFAEAEADLFACLAGITYPPSASARNQILFAQFLFAEIQLEYGNRPAATASLHAASTWANACDVPQYKLQIERVRARLSAFECGKEHAVLKLQEMLARAYELQSSLKETSFEDIVFDVLFTLEQVHRENGDIDGANRWLNSIGERLRTNAARMLDALTDKPLLVDEATVAAKMVEIDRYLHARSEASPVPFGTATSTWTYLIGLAANASGVEDPTKEHGVRVARLARLVARELGVPDDLQRGIEAGCLIHDVGKVSVPASILIKRTTLDVAELHLYDRHPEVGSELLERVKLPEQSVLRNVVRYHHHSYEGATSCAQLCGEAIPLEARIAAICDEYDSLVTGRPRRPAISINDAVREIFAQRAGKFDPKVVDVFVEIVRGLQRTHPDLQAYLAEDAENIEYFAMQRTLKRAAEHALTDN